LSVYVSMKIYYGMIVIHVCDEYHNCDTCV